MKVTLVWSDCGRYKVPDDSIIDISLLTDWPSDCGCQRCVDFVLNDRNNSWKRSTILSQLGVDPQIVNDALVIERVEEIKQEKRQTREFYNRVTAERDAKREIYDA